jgi:hypothetical protein
MAFPLVVASGFCRFDGFAASLSSGSACVQAGDAIHASATIKHDSMESLTANSLMKPRIRRILLRNQHHVECLTGNRERDPERRP